MGSQWRAGFDGPTGLDYGAARAVDPEMWELTFPLVQALETERLGLWADQREKQRKDEEARAPKSKKR